MIHLIKNLPWNCFWILFNFKKHFRHDKVYVKWVIFIFSGMENRLKMFPEQNYYRKLPKNDQFQSKTSTSGFHRIFPVYHDFSNRLFFCRTEAFFSFTTSHISPSKSMDNIFFQGKTPRHKIWLCCLWDRISRKLPGTCKLRYSISSSAHLDLYFDIYIDPLSNRPKMGHILAGLFNLFLN